MATKQKLAYPIEEGFELIGVTRSSGYKAIASGALRTYKDGKRRMVTHKALEDYVADRERASNGRKAA